MEGLGQSIVINFECSVGLISPRLLFIMANGTWFQENALSTVHSPPHRHSQRVTVMFSALQEGVFQPTVAVEYTDDEMGFAAEGQGGGKVVREEVRISFGG